VAARIHPTAVVEPGAKLADDVEIGAHAYVGGDVELAAGVVLRPHACVTGRTSIGEGSRVFPFAALGEEPQDHSFSGEATQLAIGRGTTIREHAVIHVGTRRGGGCTRIGDDVLIMNGVHIGHDGQVGSHVIIASLCGIAGHVQIEEYAVVGGLTGVHQFVRIGESAMVAATSAVSKDVPPFALVSGDRARLSGLNVVGLRRRDFPAETRQRIHRAYHILFHSKLRFVTAAMRVRDEIQGCPEVERLLRFLESSERGFVR
jgi:UDP-N-acetylglucosamine acyltransferase